MILRISLLAFLLAASPSARAQSPPPRVATEKQQLPPGKTSGTFAFTYTAKVRFTQEPVFPLAVAILDYAMRPIDKINVPDENEFTLSVDLAPGSYWIESILALPQDKLYWNAFGPRFFIDPKGVASWDSGATSHELILSKKMTILDPPPLKPITVTEPRPLLKWQPLPGAGRYRVQWLIEDAPNHVDGRGEGETTASEFRLPEDLVPNRCYEWSVWAYAANASVSPLNSSLGYWSAAYFYSPGGKELFQKISAVPPKPQHGASYLGLMPRPSFSLQGLSGPQGLVIMTVGSGSPAMMAGLQPDDLIVALNGKPLASVSVIDFVKIVRAISPGTTVPIEFVRNNVKQTVPITVGAMP